MTTKTDIQKTPAKQPQKAAGNSVFRLPGSTGKELDLETGYSYFGARYLDNALSTAWLSVDPMSDKYPNISPYAYCSWNPVKLVDPDGRDTIKIHIDIGRFLHIQSEGDHCIEFYSARNKIENETMIISREICNNINELDIEVIDYIRYGEKCSATTMFLEFSNPVTGKAVFEKIAELGASRWQESTEWDYHVFDSRGELSSSGLKDMMITSPDRYKDFKEWDHFHPFLGDESFYPSHTDQEYAQEHQNSKCVIYSQGKHMEFGKIIPKTIGQYIEPSRFATIWRSMAL